MLGVRVCDHGIRGRETRTRGRRRRRSWTAAARALAGGGRVGGDGGAAADGGSGNVEGVDMAYGRRRLLTERQESGCASERHRPLMKTERGVAAATKETGQRRCR